MIHAMPCSVVCVFQCRVGFELHARTVSVIVRSNIAAQSAMCSGRRMCGEIAGMKSSNGNSSRSIADAGRTCLRPPPVRPFGIAIGTSSDAATA